MSFARLPAELQIHVFSYLTARDLKAARATCTNFRNNASTALFRSVITCARYQAMGAFQNISQHPVYPTYVKEIVFDGSSYQGSPARSELSYQHLANQFEELKGVVSWARRNRFKKYQELYKEQEAMKESYVLLHTVARALHLMPNVTSLVYSPGPHHIPVEAKDMKDILPRSVRPGTVSHDGIQHLIGAIYASQYTGIIEFRVLPLTSPKQNISGAEFNLSAFYFSTLDDIEAGKYFFRNLRKISLDITSAHGPTGTRAIECLTNMATLLAEARDLLDLSLRISPWNANPHIMFGHIIPQGQPICLHLGLKTKWQKLRSLSLEGIYADEEDFKEMISRHKDTLDSLTFKYCSLFSGKWSNIVDDVVFGTNITPFVLGQVNETMIGEERFEDLGNEVERWQYAGKAMVNSEGERYFDEPKHTSVYAWRTQPMDES